MHLQARLSYNGACTSGVRLRDLSASLGGDWLMGTMIDLNDLRSDGYMSIDLCASNQYVVGTAHVYMNGSELSVDVDFASSADVEINQSTVYVATDCAAFAKGQYPAAHDLGEWISVGGADSALLYLPMQISYNPAGLSSFYYNADAVRRQISLWDENQSRNRSSDFVPAQPKADDGWSDDGWSSGWGSTEGWVEGAGWD